MPRRKAAQHVPIKPWLSAKQDNREGRFIQIGNSLLLSKEFQSLNGTAKHLYFCMAMEAGLYNQVKFTHSAAKKYGISSTSFERAVKELIEGQYIELVTDGSGYRPQFAPNVYRFVFDWKTNKQALGRKE